MELKETRPSILNKGIAPDRGNVVSVPSDGHAAAVSLVS